MNIKLTPEEYSVLYNKANKEIIFGGDEGISFKAGVNAVIDFLNKTKKSKPLTVDFIKSRGFKLTDTIHEDEFYYENYYNSKCPDLTIFFNFFNDGKVTYDMELNGSELREVGEEELDIILKIATPIQQPYNVEPPESNVV